MGDEELNFTEEEARCWADDARNQPEKGGKLLRPLTVCFLLVIAVLLIIWLTSSPAFQDQAAVQPLRSALTRFSWRVVI